MPVIEELEDSLLTNFQNDIDVSGIDCAYFNNLKHGMFMEILHSSGCEEIFSTDKKPISITLEESLIETLETLLECYVVQNCTTIEKQLELFIIGVASLEAFLQSNWVGPPLEDFFLCLPWLRTLYKEATVTDEQIRNQITSCLVLDGESCGYILHEELLLLACVVLKLCAEKFTDLMSSKWWWMRCMFTHQQILEEHSESLYGNLKLIMEEHLNPDTMTPMSKKVMEKEDRDILFHLEAIRIYVYYSEVVPAKHLFDLVLKKLKIEMELVGAMGKRTRYQQKEYAQLILRVTKESQDDDSVSSTIPHNEDCLPVNVSLNDDVRLNQIAFSKEEGGGEAAACPRLSPLGQSAVIAKFALTQRSQPKDRLADEELMAYVTWLTGCATGWAGRTFALLSRSRLESGHRRTVERSLDQVRALAEGAGRGCPSDARHRLRLVFTSHLPSRWEVEATLAGLLASLGCANAALDIYRRLERWEEMVGCYNALQLRHKAAEVVRTEMDRSGETPKLWCLLGDATDDADCYRRAWELSGGRSARAARHWGLHHFARKQYAESIEHFRRSLAINSLQLSVWFMLGFAAMDQEQWELSASAYRRYTGLDPDSFEAWNNLGRAYVKLGEKRRAWLTFREAVKCNFDTWQVWDNYMVVSVDCSEYDEVIRSYHRLLDLKGKHVDERVIEILVTAVVKDMPDNAGQPSSLLRKKALALMGRITGQVTTNASLWRLYAELTASAEPQTPETLERTAQYLQRAHRAATQNASWHAHPRLCLEVMELCNVLVNSYMECCKKCPSPQHQLKLLNSVKFSLQGVITRVKKEHFESPNVDINGVNELLASTLETLECQLKLVLQNMSDLQLQTTQSESSR